MFVALGVDAKQLAIFSHRAQEGNERSRVQRARDAKQTRGQSNTADQLQSRQSDTMVARLPLARSYHNILTLSGCEMNEWGEEDSEGREEMDGGGERERKAAEKEAVGPN